jgi:hypothetical protein
VWERETTVVKSVLSHHLFDGAVNVEGVDLTTVISFSHIFYSDCPIIEVVT